MAAVHSPPAIVVFAPDPLVGVTVEAGGEGDEVHMHAAGQGVWVARMAAEMGVRPVLCCLAGGESGSVLMSLLAALPGERRVTSTAGQSGTYVVDRRGGERRLVAASLRPAPRRHEVDDLVGATCAAAYESALVVICNPYPAEGFPLEAYETVADDVRQAGVPLLVDLSSPRLERTLGAHPDLVKLNDWELAAYVNGPVDGPAALVAASRLQAAGARTVAVTRGGGPILLLQDGCPAVEVVPPTLRRGYREGCGDAMMGAIAAAWALGHPLRDAVVTGAAAGSANFLRHGLGTGRRAVVAELARHVTVRRLGAQPPGAMAAPRTAA